MVYDMIKSQWMYRKTQSQVDIDIHDDVVSRIIEFDNNNIFRVDMLDLDKCPDLKKIKRKWDLAFYRLNFDKLEWEMLRDSDIKDTTWFIGNFFSYITKRKRSQTVPQFCFIDDTTGKIRLVLDNINKPFEKNATLRLFYPSRSYYLIRIFLSKFLNIFL